MCHELPRVPAFGPGLFSKTWLVKPGGTPPGLHLGISRWTGRKPITLDCPGGPGVKDLPANAGGTGSCLVREDPTRRGVSKAVHTATEPVLQSPRSARRDMPQEKLPHRSWRSLRSPAADGAPAGRSHRKPACSNGDLAQPKIKLITFLKKKIQHSAFKCPLPLFFKNLNQGTHIHWTSKQNDPPSESACSIPHPLRQANGQACSRFQTEFLSLSLSDWSFTQIIT